jgi:xylulokinase
MAWRKAQAPAVNKFPRLVRSIDKVGGLTPEAAEVCGLLAGTPVFGGCGDMQSAAIRVKADIA